jgi:hypothetical protein
VAIDLKHAELPSEDLSIDVSGLVGPHVEPSGELSPVSNMAELFGPCSPVWRSPRPVILPSLVEACTSTDSLVREETCAISADSITCEKSIEQAIAAPLDAPTVIEGTLLDVVTLVEDFVLVEDANDDEEVVSQEDAPMHSMVEVNAGTSQQMEAPPIKATSSSSATARMEQDVACPPIHLPSPPAMKTRRRRKSYDKSSLRQSVRLARRSVLNDLGIVGKDGKLDDDAMQDVVDCLKELLPLDLLKSLMGLKGPAF